MPNLAPNRMPVPRRVIGAVAALAVAAGIGGVAKNLHDNDPLHQANGIELAQPSLGALQNNDGVLPPSESGPEKSTATASDQSNQPERSEAEDKSNDKHEAGPAPPRIDIKLGIKKGDATTSDDYELILGDKYTDEIEENSEEESSEPEQEPILYDPENIRVTPEAAAIMRRETLLIAGCSAFAIRNQQSELIGAYSARHCGYQFQQGHWQDDENGNTVMHFNYPLVVNALDIENQTVKPVAKVKQVVIDRSDETTSDQAVLIFDNADVETVLAQRRQDSVETIQTEIADGDVLYAAGFPTSPDGSSRSYKELALQKLGVWENAPIGSKESGLQFRANLLITGLPKEQGRLCQPGLSGAGVFRLDEQGNYSIVGTETSSIDLDESNPNTAVAKEYFAKRFGIDITPYSKICMTSYEPPAEDALVAPIIDLSEVPEYPPPETDPGTQYKELVLQANQHRQMVNGIVEMRIGKSWFAIDRPAVYWNNDRESFFIAWFSPYNDELIVSELTQDSMRIYQRNTEMPLSIISSEAAASIDKEKNALIDEKEGYAFGVAIDEEPSDLGPASIMTVNPKDGSLGFVPAPPDKPSPTEKPGPKG